MLRWRGVQLQEMEESAALVATLLLSEPPETPIVIGGFSMGACVALESAVYFARGRFPSGNPYPPINLKAVVSLNGHFHGSSSFGRVKFICPTAPTGNVQGFPGNPYNAWFNVNGLKDSFEDMEGLEASVANAIYQLSTEPSNIKLGIGGVGMGACVALYSATSFVLGGYANGSAFPPININFIFSLSGDLPDPRNMNVEIGRSNTAPMKAATLPLLICHGMVDDKVRLGKQWSTQPGCTQLDLKVSSFGKLQRWTTTRL